MLRDPRPASRIGTKGLAGAGCAASRMGGRVRYADADAGPPVRESCRMRARGASRLLIQIRKRDGRCGVARSRVRDRGKVNYRFRANYMNEMRAGARSRTKGGRDAHCGWMNTRFAIAPAACC